MSENRIEGAAKKAAGAVKEEVGKVTGDTSMEIKGKVEKADGDIQNKAGKVQDALK